MKFPLYLLISLVVANSLGAKAQTSILPNEPEALSHTLGPSPSGIEDKKQEQEEKKKIDKDDKNESLESEDDSRAEKR